MIITDKEFLHSKCENAAPEEIGGIIEQLEKELERSGNLGKPGIGLAAIQIGIKKNVAIVRMNNYYSADLVNCSIKNGYNKTLFKDEGCLSIPGELFDTDRYQEIEVENDVYPNNFIATGLFAVAVQHELDHNKGILASDIALPKKELVKKLSPNEKCYCGSLVKYKRCHGK